MGGELLQLGRWHDLGCDRGGLHPRNMPYGLRDALTEQEAWDVASFVDSHERPQDPRFNGNLAETRARYHDSKWSMYGTEQRGIRLGDPTNYPLTGGR